VTSLSTHQSHIWIDYVGETCTKLSKSPCITIDFSIKMSEKYKSPSPSAMQMKNGCKTSNIEEKLYVISQLEKGDRTFDICHNVGYTHISIPTIRDNANRITGVLSQELKYLNSKTTTFLTE